VKNEAILLEAVALADEILEKGSTEGRGLRLAALVLRLNESMVSGETPMSWEPHVPVSKVLSSLPPPPRVPGYRAALASLPEDEEFVAAWEKVISPSTAPGDWIELTDKDFE